MTALLEVQDLHTHFPTEGGLVRAVDGVSFHLAAGETLAVVGESGSGKSVTSLSIMRLIEPPGRIVSGRILFDGTDLAQLGPRAMRAIRGNDIGMIFQEPMTSLNPVHTVGAQIAEAVMLHQARGQRAAMTAAVEMLELVGIPDPVRRARAYPHELSGGMRQRVMIAMSLSCRPRLLIADEPTTALDVTIQAQILDLMRRLQREFGMAILFITHDLGVVAEMADRVVVMYGGRAVEEAAVADVFARPLMPYTAGLMNSIPRLDRAADTQARLLAIPGQVPNPLRMPAGCGFHPRCGFAEPACVAEDQALQDAGGRMVRCRRWRELTLAAA